MQTISITITAHVFSSLNTASGRMGDMDLHKISWHPHPYNLSIFLHKTENLCCINNKAAALQSQSKSSEEIGYFEGVFPLK